MYGGESKAQRIWRENQGLERIQAIYEENPENTAVWSILKACAMWPGVK